MSNGVNPVTYMGNPRRHVSVTTAETLTVWPEKERDWMKSKKGDRYPKFYRQETG